MPASLRAQPRRSPVGPAAGLGTAPPPPSPERTAAAHARLEAARAAYTGGQLEAGDRELGLAMRMDPRVASEGIAMVEPTLGRQPPADRLLLYGDLLRAAGRPADASEAYDRAARS